MNNDSLISALIALSNLPSQSPKAQASFSAWERGAELVEQCSAVEVVHAFSVLKAHLSKSKGWGAGLELDLSCSAVARFSQAALNQFSRARGDVADSAWDLSLSVLKPQLTTSCPLPSQSSFNVLCNGSLVIARAGKFFGIQAPTAVLPIGRTQLQDEFRALISAHPEVSVEHLALIQNMALSERSPSAQMLLTQASDVIFNCNGQSIVLIGEQVCLDNSALKVPALLDCFKTNGAGFTLLRVFEDCVYIHPVGELSCDLNLLLQDQAGLLKNNQTVYLPLVQNTSSLSQVVWEKMSQADSSPLTLASEMEPSTRQAWRLLLERTVIWNLVNCLQVETYPVFGNSATTPVGGPVSAAFHELSLKHNHRVLVLRCGFGALPSIEVLSSLDLAAYFESVASALLKNLISVPTGRELAKSISVCPVNPARSVKPSHLISLASNKKLEAYRAGLVDLAQLSYSQALELNEGVLEQSELWASVISEIQGPYLVIQVPCPIQLDSLHEQARRLSQSLGVDLRVVVPQYGFDCQYFNGSVEGDNTLLEVSTN